MKKLALLAAILLLCGLTAAFADASFDVSGSASVTFGYDLDTEGAGFENATDLDIVVWLIPQATVASEGESGWYGWIEFADMGVGWSNDSDSDFYWYYYQAAYDDPADPDYEQDWNPALYVYLPDVTAKITNGPIYFQIYGAPAFDADHAMYIEDDDPDDDDYLVQGDIGEYIEDGFLQWNADFAPQGITLGYDSDMIDVAVYVADADQYVSAEDWAIGANVGLSAAGFAVSLDVAKGVELQDNSLYFGADVEYTLDLGMGSLVPYVGFDYLMSDSIDPAAWELAAGANMTFTNSDAFGVAFWMNDADESMALEATFTEDGEAGFVPGLGAELLFGGYDAFDRYVIALDVSYMIGAIKPFAGFQYGNDGVDALAKANAGVAWTGLPHTTITAEWTSGELLVAELKGQIELTAEIEM